MKLLDYRHPELAGDPVITLYALGDVHIGALNCALPHFKAVLREIDQDPYALWFGGGDIVDAILPQDQKRFDPGTLPDWMLKGKPDAIRMRLKDMIASEVGMAKDLLHGIRGKCLGLIEGNHEFEVMKRHNRDVTRELCDSLGVPHLTDCFFARLLFKKAGHVASCKLYAAHGCGGGRTPGAEAGHLARMAADKDADIVLRGHSHTQFILPPLVRLSVPSRGALGAETTSRAVRAANWGCYLKTLAAGPSTYDSRAQYPARPLSTVRVRIRPFYKEPGGVRMRPRITMEEMEM
jgi:hypothetical protein